MSEVPTVIRPERPSPPPKREPRYAPENPLPQVHRTENTTRERRRTIASMLAESQALVRAFEPTRASFGDLPSSQAIDVAQFRIAAGRMLQAGLERAAATWEARAAKLERWEKAYAAIEKWSARVGAWGWREESDEQLVAEGRAELRAIVKEHRLDGGGLPFLTAFAGGAE